MPRIAKTALLPYPAPDVFDLVNDIEAYPQYMEGCVGSQVLVKTELLVEARLDLARAGIAQSFTTRNHLQRPETIRMELLSGPFTRLGGCWQFTALTADACKVSLDLEFEMDGKLASLAAGKLFEAVASGLVDTLCRRANRLYGNAS